LWKAIHGFTNFKNGVKTLPKVKETTKYLKNELDISKTAAKLEKSADQIGLLAQETSNLNQVGTVVIANVSSLETAKLLFQTQLTKTLTSKFDWGLRAIPFFIDVGIHFRKFRKGQIDSTQFAQLIAVSAASAATSSVFVAFTSSVGTALGSLFGKSYGTLIGCVVGTGVGISISHLLDKIVFEKFTEKYIFNPETVYRAALKEVGLKDSDEEEVISKKKRLMLSDTHPERAKDPDNKKDFEKRYCNLELRFQIVKAYREDQGRWQNNDEVSYLEISVQL